MNICNFALEPLSSIVFDLRNVNTFLSLEIYETTASPYSNLVYFLAYHGYGACKSHCKPSVFIVAKIQQLFMKLIQVIVEFDTDVLTKGSLCYQ